MNAGIGNEYSFNYFEGVKLQMIDFNHATPFLDFTTGQHLAQVSTDRIQSFENIFNSNTQLQFKSTSRRDDIDSLCQVMIYLLNNKTLPDMKIPQSARQNDQ